MDKETLITLAADIVGAHVSNNSVAMADVAGLIQTVFGALQSASQPSGNCSGSLFPRLSFCVHLSRPGCVRQAGRGIGAPARVSRMASMARTDRRRPVSTAVRTSA